MSLIVLLGEPIFSQQQTGTVSGQTPATGNVLLVRSKNVYYENTVKRIVQTDCGRCHSGATRNLMDYDSLKTYADSGLLGTMVQGPMRRFAGNDMQTILDWIQNGAPEKPVAAKAGFRHTPAMAGTAQGGTVTYSNTIKGILAKDCLRCHSDAFRNLTTYRNVKMYVDNGLLQSLVLPGGPMHRFAGPDTHLFMAWIKSGALR